MIEWFKSMINIGRIVMVLILIEITIIIKMRNLKVIAAFLPRSRSIILERCSVESTFTPPYAREY